MDQDPFAGTGQHTSDSYGYGAEPGIESQGGSTSGQEGRGGSPMHGGGERGRSDDDVGRIQSFLEDQLRERPLPTLLLGVLAGWVAGKLLR